MSPVKTEFGSIRRVLSLNTRKNKLQEEEKIKGILQIVELYPNRKQNKTPVVLM